MYFSSCIRGGPPVAFLNFASSSATTPVPLLGVLPDASPRCFQSQTMCRSPGAVEPDVAPLRVEVRQGPLSIVPLAGRRGRPRALRRRPRRCAAATCPSPLTGPSGSIAPSQTESVGSGTSRSGSKSCRTPRPSHAGHIPCGLLKLNSCGLGGSKLMPQCGAGVVRREEQVGLSPRRATITVPSPSFSACSTASASRGRTAGPGLQPVDHDLDVVLDLPVELQVVGQRDDLRRRPGPGRSRASPGRRTGPCTPPSGRGSPGRGRENAVPVGQRQDPARRSARGSAPRSAGRTSGSAPGRPGRRGRGGSR